MRYRKELRADKEAVNLLKQKSEVGTVTLVYGAKDQEHNEALVLQKMLDRGHKGQSAR